MNPGRPFGESRAEMLKDPELAAMYLEDCLADGDVETFKAALRHVAEARLGGLSALSESAHLSQDDVSRSLSEKGDPGINALTKMLAAMGMRIGFSHIRPLN